MDVDATPDRTEVLKVLEADSPLRAGAMRVDYTGRWRQRSYNDDREGIRSTDAIAGVQA